MNDDIELARYKLKKLIIATERLTDCKVVSLSQELDKLITNLTGIEVLEALKVSKILAEQGISAEIINIHKLKPIDKDAIVKSAKKTGAIVTCQNHNVMGGLKAAVAEVLIEEYQVLLKVIGVQDHFVEVGSMDQLMKKYKMTAEDIVEAAKEVIKKKL